MRAMPFLAKQYSSQYYPAQQHCSERERWAFHEGFPIAQ